MRRYLRLAFLVLAPSLGLASGVGAQGVIMGNTVTPNAGDAVVSDVRTDIDLVNPASATGTINTATFTWSTAPCPSAVKIKVFRRQGDNLIFIAERGSFDVTATSMTVSLAPAIPVEQGDLIAIARVANCGNPETLTGLVSAGYLSYSSDVSSNVTIAEAEGNGGGILNVRATGIATESIAAVLTAAGSTPGNFGSFFKTGVQLSNPGASEISGRFVYHRAGVPGTSADPSLNFTVGAHSTISYPDLVAAMGQTGLGSIDVVVPDTSDLPVIVARVYNDAGADGTSGFTEDAIDPSGSFENRVVFAGATGFLVAPPDVANFRFNIGIRSLLSGALVNFRVRDAGGVIVREVTKTYTSTFYEQQPADTLLGGPILANDQIEVSVSSGSAIIYGATVDNTTQDPSIQFVRVLFAIL